MTIGMAWIRRTPEGEELLFASDSRISGDGYIWDDCPKLFTLPRRDAVIGFSGSTGQAYPLVLQLTNAISSHLPAADGSLEFFRMLGHLERVANSMMDRLTIDPAIIGAQSNHREFATSGDSLVLGGYSRLKGRMVISKLRYQHTPGEWRFERVRPVRSFGSERVIAFFGDSVSQSRCKYLLRLYLEKRGTLKLKISFDLEPLEVLGSFLGMSTSSARRLPIKNRPPTIGGAPQVIRVLSGANAMTFAVSWGSGKEKKVYLHGRPIYGYERLNVPLITFEEKSHIQIHAPGQWSNQNLDEQK